MKITLALASLAAASLLTGCAAAPSGNAGAKAANSGTASQARHTASAPNVVGLPLDKAHQAFEALGIKEFNDKDAFENRTALVDSNWVVLGQDPAAGTTVDTDTKITLTIGKIGEDRTTARLPLATEKSKDPSTEPTPLATEKSEEPSTEPTALATEKSDSPPTTITDIAVDALLDTLNSANMGGIKLGDQFRLTAELFEDDAWFTGATGEYSVELKAKDGKDDLLVFVDKSDAAGWHNGTKVEMVVRAEERTVNGETSGGWLKAQSVMTLSG